MEILVRFEMGISLDDVQPGWSGFDQSEVYGTGFAVCNLHSSLLLAALKPLGTEKQALLFSTITKRVSESQVMEEAVTCV